MRRTYKDIVVGASIGIGIGLILLSGMILLGYSRSKPHPAAQPMSIQSATPASPLIPSPTWPISPTSSLALPSSTPISTPTPVVYIVQEGDALFNIAIDHNTTVEAIKAANGLTSDYIHPGQELVIPPSTATTLPTSTPLAAEAEFVVHIVAFGETLIGIAEKYDVTVESIQSANGLTSDAIQAGQELVIFIDESPVSVSTPDPGTQVWQPSVLEGDLEAAYPLTLETDRFTLHYQPASPPARELDTVVAMVETALAHIEKMLQVHLEGTFDVYAAGSLFASPNLTLRGRSFSSQRRFFFLYDGTGIPADHQYIIAHELTHLTTWNTMGRPASVMLHEGVAVYVGMELVEDKSYIPIESYCAAYYQLGQLPSLSTSPSFQGHIRDLDTYYAAGCFVQYLIEKYGIGNFAEVYYTGDYYSVYGQSLKDLETEWIVTLEDSDHSLSFDPHRLEHYVAEVAAAYDRLFSNFTATTAQMNAYWDLDQARIDVLQGRFDDAEIHLTSFDQLLSNGIME